MISERGILIAEKLKEIDQKIKLDVRNAADLAREAEQPAPSELYTDVYATQAITND